MTAGTEGKTKNSISIRKRMMQIFTVLISLTGLCITILFIFV